MPTHHESPEEKRERLRQKESKQHPTASLKDGIDRSHHVSGGMGWKETGVLLLVFIIGVIVYQLVF